MKLIQYIANNDSARQVKAGVLVDERIVVEVPGVKSMRELIEQIEASADFRSKLEQASAEGEQQLTLEDVSLCAPITDPNKMICIGLNYHDHVIESNMQVPKQPVLFPKYNNALVGPDGDVIIPEDTQQCDYEVELAFIVGKRAKRVPIEEAMDYIFGYTIMNDVSARDIQLSEGQWTRGKTIDTFGPVGPCIVTADEIPDPQNLRISLKLNGETMQDGSTKELIFNVPYLLSFLSRTMTLEPGDIVSTGTPPGVGMGRTPQVWLKPGDVTEATIEGIGTLRNFYKAENE